MGWEKRDDNTPFECSRKLGHVDPLRFWNEPAYSGAFNGRQAQRSACCEGYVGALRSTCEEIGAVSTLNCTGSRIDALAAGSDDCWNDIVVVRHENFANSRRKASPHGMAAIADWHFVTTRGF